MDHLPDELLLYIFLYLPLESVVLCEDVSFRWRRLLRATAIWNCLVVCYSGQKNKILNNENDFNFKIIKTHSHCIRHLKLSYIDDYNILLDLLKHCSNLIKLELTMCKINKEIMDEINRMAQLTKLNLKNAQLSVNQKELLVPLKNLKKLEFLQLSNFGLNSFNVIDALRCNCLTHIYIDKITSLTQNDIISVLQTKTFKLKALQIYGGHSVNDAIVDLICSCKNLEDLGIVHCENLTDSSLKSLTKLMIIRSLRLWNNEKFTATELYKTFSSTNFFQIKTLSLSKITNLTKETIFVLATKYTLRHLALYLCLRISKDSDFVKQIETTLFPNVDVFII